MVYATWPLYGDENVAGHGSWQRGLMQPVQRGLLQPSWGMIRLYGNENNDDDPDDIETTKEDNYLLQ